MLDLKVLDTVGDRLKRQRTMAKSLINTRFFPPVFQAVRTLALEAQAYHNLRPYPYWEFAGWNTEIKGALPRCLPLARRIVIKSARWLFGRPIQLSVSENLDIETIIRQAWEYNRMPTRMVAAAEMGGTDGGIILKWSYDEDSETCLRFQILSAINDCRMFFDPHDSDVILMARIQYPVFNPQDGETYIYREEWTDEEEIHYEPQRMTQANIFRASSGGMFSPYPIGQVPVISGSKTEADLYDRWVITSQTANPFGIIPCHLVKNAESLSTFGKGDLWTDATGGMFRLMDRINLTYQGADRNNQMYADPATIFIDALVGSDILDRPTQPGSAVSIKTDYNNMDATIKQAQVMQLEADGTMRPHMRDYAEDLKSEILKTVGGVDVDSNSVTNKGAMTEAVLIQLYSPLIETTEEKRKTYGEDGICKFLEKCILGLSNLGVKDFGGVNIKDHGSHDVQIRWSDYFETDDLSKQARFSRISQEVDAGYIPHELGVEIILQSEGVTDILGAKEDLAGVMELNGKVREAKANAIISPPPPVVLPVVPSTRYGGKK